MSTRRRPLTLLSALGLLLGLVAGCQSSKPDLTGQKSDGFPAPSRTHVWSAARQAMTNRGFVMDIASTSEANGVVQSKWRSQLAPFSGLGFRERVTIQIHDVPGNAGYHRVETNVIREQNKNVTAPSDPAMAEWGNSERNRDLENLITREVESQFLTFQASPEFAERNNLRQNDLRLRNPEPETPEPSRPSFPDPLGLFGD